MTLIAFVSIPGGGGTTLTQRLSKALKGTGFWLSEAVELSQEFHLPADNFAFGLRTRFRLLRIKQLYEAQKVSHRGGIAIVDGYYDKLMRFYLGQPGTSWIMKPNNLYFNVTKEIAEIDYHELPNADIVIGLRLTQDVWKCFLNIRRRPLDLDIHFQNECFSAQEIFLNAAQQYCHDFNKTYIEVNQRFGPIEQNVKNIQKKLKQIGL